MDRHRSNPRPSGQAAIGGNPAATSQTPQAHRVLIVEDHDDTRAMYVAYLRHRGYDVVEAANGQDAQELALAHTPEVIVMDMALPRLDGWEVTRRLKAEPRTRQIPIVALTGHSLADHEREARAAGCAGFLVKPCLPNVLASEIERMLTPDEGHG